MPDKAGLSARTGPSMCRWSATKALPENAIYVRDGGCTVIFT